MPLACGERSSTLYGFRELIERDIVDVVQPDTGRAGGLLQMKKVAAQAEAHHIMVAPHDGSLGPIAEAAAVHLMATLPNFLILEHMADDVPWRYELMTEFPLQDSHFIVPDRPGPRYRTERSGRPCPSWRPERQPAGTGSTHLRRIAHESPPADAAVAPWWRKLTEVTV